MHGLGMRGEQGLGGQISLGHPRAFVQQPRGLEQWLDVHLVRLAAELRSRCTLAANKRAYSVLPKNSS